jgi:DNA-binding MarR family transcriptional regulator
MENTLLEDVGLTAAEAAVYLALLELDKTKSGAVIEKTGLQPSVVFHALHSLRAKGLLTSVKIANTIAMQRRARPRCGICSNNAKRVSRKHCLSCLREK